LSDVDGNLAVTDGMSFSVIASDHYTILSNLKIHVSSTNLYQNYYDETNSLLNGFSVGLSVAVAAAIGFLVFRHIRRRQNTNNQDNER
jgi:hypothetical protein